MLWEVNLRKNEWDKLQEELQKYHKNEKRRLKKIIRDIVILLSDDNCFEITQISSNLLLLLQMIQTDILPLIDTVFEDTEQCVHTFIVGNNNIDTIL